MNKLIWFTIGWAVVFICVALFGCSMLSNPPTEPLTPKDVYYDSIKDIGGLNWLLILGTVGGLFAFLNGSTKAGLAGALACLSGVIINLSIVKFESLFTILGLIVVVGALGYSFFIKGKGVWFENLKIKTNGKEK